MVSRWPIAEGDISAVQKVLRVTKNSRFVANRIQRNVSGCAPEFSGDEFWRVLLGCLLTTQQKSGPGSAVARFLMLKPFPLSLSCFRNGSVSGKVLRTLTDFGGIRRTKTIGLQAQINLEWLESGGWRLVESVFSDLNGQRQRTARQGDTSLERYAANFADDNLRGIGPKQSRNLWQWLGLTRYEIPVDSRVTSWLNRQTSHPEVRAVGLANRKYYEAVMDDIQALCQACGVLPCVFDGAVFAFYDREWNVEELDN